MERRPHRGQHIRPWQTGGDYPNCRSAPVEGIAEMALENHVSQWRQREYPRSFEACVAEVEAEFTHWCAATSEAPENWHTARLTAAYTCWSALVEPRGWVRRRVMLSSKNSMHSLWTWDCFFFAQTYAPTQPDLAWDQWAIVFDYMDRDGAVPNQLNLNSAVGSDDLRF